LAPQAAAACELGKEVVGRSTRYDGTEGFEVMTKHGMNIGNLIEVEKRWGFSVHYFEPHPEGIHHSTHIYIDRDNFY
jgi:hypothetical protein